MGHASHHGADQEYVKDGPHLVSHDDDDVHWPHKEREAKAAVSRWLSHEDHAFQATVLDHYYSQNTIPLAISQGARSGARSVEVASTWSQPGASPSIDRLLEWKSSTREPSASDRILALDDSLSQNPTCAQASDQQGQFMHGRSDRVTDRRKPQLSARACDDDHVGDWVGAFKLETIVADLTDAGRSKGMLWRERGRSSFFVTLVERRTRLRLIRADQGQSPLLTVDERSYLVVDGMHFHPEKRPWSFTVSCYVQPSKGTLSFRWGLQHRLLDPAGWTIDTPSQLRGSRHLSSTVGELRRAGCDSATISFWEQMNDYIDKDSATRFEIVSLNPYRGASNLANPALYMVDAEGLKILNESSEEAETTEQALMERSIWITGIDSRTR